MATGIYDDRGIRFEYPAGWEVEAAEDGDRATVSIQTPGPAFAFLTLDPSRPAPAAEADQARDAMREEYPNLESAPARESIDGHPAVGHDLEFFSLDEVVSCAIRAFRTPRRTVLIFAQWPDRDGDDPGLAFLALRRSLEETDA